MPAFGGVTSGSTQNPPTKSTKAPVLPPAKATPASAAAAAAAVHPNQYHYRTLDADAVPIPDFHTKKRVHTGLAAGTLDDDGILAHTDFDIDLTRIDPDNDEHFAEYVKRRKTFEEQLKVLYDKTESTSRGARPTDGQRRAVARMMADRDSFFPSLVSRVVLLSFLIVLLSPSRARSLEAASEHHLRSSLPEFDLQGLQRGAQRAVRAELPASREAL